MLVVMRRAVLVGWLAMVACGTTDGPRAIPVRDVVVTAASTTLLVGATTQLSAVVTGADGNVLQGASVTWSSASPTIVSVSTSGTVTALATGSGTVRAASGGRSGEVVLTVKNPPVAALAFDRDSAIVALPNGTVALVPGAKDAAGRPINNPTFFYSTDAPKVASVSQLGLVTAVAAGVATISASADGVTATVRVRVTANATPTSPRITSVSALLAGTSATISGSNFASSVSGNAVLVEGIPVTVTAATSTQLTITLPTSGWACAAERPVSLQVNANNEVGVATATLRTAIARTLSVGQSVVLATQSESRCNELATTGGAYLVTVYHPARAANGGTAFQLRGTASVPRLSAAASSTARLAAVASSTAVAHSAFAQSAASRRALPDLSFSATSVGQGLQRVQERAQERRADDAHARLMQRSIDFARANGSPSAAWRRMRASTEGAAAASARAFEMTTPGAITALKIPNLDAQNFCTASIAVGARTVWVGQHAVIVEDTASLYNGTPTLKGQLDAMYAQVGQEFDDVMWPILTRNFGNPLAMDQQLSKTGKIVMLFSPRVNTMSGGLLAGFVASCDFYPTSVAPSSNVGEYFYAIVPTSLAAGAGLGTRESWLRQMRSTVIHEGKHITSFGERIARATSQNVPYEELWLEEGLARHAEEQYARGIYGVTATGNTGYAASVYCDLNLSTAAECAGRPHLMGRHFDALYQYLQSPEPLTVLGWTTPSDATYYASAWSVTRWIMDQYATSEASFMSALVQSTSLGVANLEARVANHQWEEMFGEWALALYADDYPGVTFSNTRLKFAGWNLRDIFLGMCKDRGPCAGASTSTLYPVAFPLTPHSLTYGSFAETVGFLNAGTFASYLLSGTQSAPQILELKATNGGDPPPQLRVAIMRVR